MNFLFENLQIVVIVAAILFSGLQKLWEMKRKREEEQPWEPQEEDFRPIEDFQPAVPMEDLPRRVVPPPLARYVPAPEPELERQKKMEERLKAVRAAKSAGTAKPAASAKSKSKNVAPPLVSPSKLRDRLRDPKEVRRAIVMREILGPPLGLK
jgi:hypothetical protein